jgi:hypothetical protein
LSVAICQPPGSTPNTKAPGPGKNVGSTKPQRNPPIPSRTTSVDPLADIAIFADETGGTLDFDTPLVDNTLPADIDPETAARLPSDLRAAPAGCENTEHDAATEMLTATRIPPKEASGSLPETGTVNAD